MNQKRKLMTPEQLKEHIRILNKKKCENYRKTQNGKENIHRAIRNYFRRIKRKAVNLKGCKCENCGFDLPNYPSYCLIGKTNKTTKFALVKPKYRIKNINKYRLLCFNCHRNILYNKN